MLLGIDFDNTIVCYDGIFHRIALEQDLIPKGLATSKDAVRNYLRDDGREDEWTKMQGLVYGSKMDSCMPYPGVLDFFNFCKETEIPLFIISHKTRHPFMGEKYDLHKAAYSWLENQRFHDSENGGIERNRVFFETTKEQKIERIRACGCTHFIDDLPEFLLRPNFPGNVSRWLFDPANTHQEIRGLRNFVSWKDIFSEVCRVSTCSSSIKW